MLITTFAALFPLLALPQDPGPEPPAGDAEVEVVEEVSPEQAAAAIKEVLKGKDYVAIASTIEEMGAIEGKPVVKAVAAALKSKDKLVKTAAIRALRYSADPGALGELLKRKKDKGIVDDPELAVEYYYALGQAGDRKAIDVLTDGLFSGAKSDKVAKARIAALGHIRHKDSVDELMSYMVSSGGGRRGRRGGPRYAQDVRLALVILTGEDYGTNTTEWIKWWSDHKSKLKISPEEWPLPNNKMQKQWKLMWATPQEREEARKEIEERRKKRKDAEDREGDGGKDRDGGLEA